MDLPAASPLREAASSVDLQSFSSMSQSARIFCLILAASGADLVPALVFCRPFVSSQTIWSFSGEIEECKNEAIIIQDQTWKQVWMEQLDGGYRHLSESPGNSIIASSSSLGITGQKWETSFWLEDTSGVAESINRNLVTMESLNGFWNFKLVGGTDVWQQQIFSKEELMQGAIDLARMLVLSLATPYLDALWEVISLQCRSLFHTLLLPILSSSGMFKDALLNFRMYVAIDH
ncbi:hypothetical protein F5884DRAFT_339035 [Xylogone sp. PMI_703]|nr:hypothetical protein F5884DRAFT_339035 [Xylogone sp. PMI_703]